MFNMNEKNKIPVLINHRSDHTHYDHRIHIPAKREQPFFPGKMDRATRFCLPSM
jgi:hypothetical protein